MLGTMDFPRKVSTLDTFDTRKAVLSSIADTAVNSGENDDMVTPMRDRSGDDIDGDCFLLSSERKTDDSDDAGVGFAEMGVRPTADESMDFSDAPSIDFPVAAVVGGGRLEACDPAVATACLDSVCAGCGVEMIVAERSDALLMLRDRDRAVLDRDVLLLSACGPDAVAAGVRGVERCRESDAFVAGAGVGAGVDVVEAFRAGVGALADGLLLVASTVGGVSTGVRVVGRTGVLGACASSDVDEEDDGGILGEKATSCSDTACNAGFGAAGTSASVPFVTATTAHVSAPALAGSDGFVSFRFRFLAMYVCWAFHGPEPRAETTRRAP